jgi:predicted transcriptional regulator of viral defense system
MNACHIQLALKLAGTEELLRTLDVDRAGAPPGALARLALDGRMMTVSRGLYALAGRNSSEHDRLAEVSAKPSAGVRCLISALRLRKLTTQQSCEIWLAISQKSLAPRLVYSALRIVRIAGCVINRAIDNG